MKSTTCIRRPGVTAAIILLAVLTVSIGFLCVKRQKAADSGPSTNLSDTSSAVEHEAESADEPVSASPAEKVPPKKKKKAVDGRSMTVSENRKNELVFDLSINDCIEGFNNAYSGRNGQEYLLPVSSDNWTVDTLSRGVHSPYETLRFNFSEDRKAWALPTIAVYLPSDRDCVQEITLNFDQHSYSDSLSDLYDEMCYCALKMFFPDFSDEQIIKLYSTANRSGYDHPFSSDEFYGKDSVPYTLFYKDNIGVYSHFAIGSYQRLCIIPVTEKTVSEFKAKGVKIIGIE